MSTTSNSKSKAHLVGGFVGGLTSAVTLQPLDLMKTRIQQHKGSTLLSSLKEINNPLEFWRGTLPSALRTSIGSALYLSCLNLMRTSLSSRGKSTNGVSTFNKSSRLPELTMHENMATGAVSRGLVGYITMPITILKVRYESTLYSYTSITHAVRDIYLKEGIYGFFRGFGATCLRDTPYSGLYVLLYEKSKVILPRLAPRSFISYNQEGNYSTYTAASINTIGAFSSASIATTITAPFDTIKTRMQLEPNRYRNSFNTFIQIIKHENILRLFSGLSMRLTRKAFSAGIAWGIYEELIKRLS